MKLFLSSAVFFLFAFVTKAQQNNNYKSDSIQIKKIADEVMRNSTAYKNLRTLCKDIGPRLSGSSNAMKAVYAGKKMLEVAGADTVYLQPCVVPYWVRGAKEEGYVIINGLKEKIKLTSLGNSEGTNGKMLNADIVEIKKMSDFSTANVKGKIVLINIEMNPTYIKTNRAYGESGVGRRAGPSLAAKHGAIAVMVRSLASNEDDHPHTGATAYNDSFPKIPAVAISTQMANKISNVLQSGKAVKAMIKSNCKMMGTANSFNVIGELRGAQFPEQIITVGGHLDSWDLAEGAHDDGTGVVQSIEIIRSLKAQGIKPLRTIRAVLFMNEENGGGGSKAYLQNAKQKTEQHIFALESDAGGFTPRGFNLEMAPQKEQRVKEWAPLFYPYGVYDFKEKGSGADIGPLREIGTALAGLQTDSQRYFDIHHAETDVFEAVSKRELDLGTLNMAAFIWLVSEYGL